MYIYTNLKEKTFSIFFIHTTFQTTFIGMFEKCLFESDYPRHAIVYLPTSDFGQNSRETQTKVGDLKTSGQRYF